MLLSLILVFYSWVNMKKGEWKGVFQTKLTAGSTRCTLRKLGPAGRKGPDAPEFGYHWLFDERVGVLLR